MAVVFLASIPAAVQAADGKPDVLMYHPIKTDKSGHIVPWVFSDDLGRAYDHVVRKVWDFWDHMPADRNGLPYYMNHQVWNATLDDHRGIGGDQTAMAMSSWALLYAYMGRTTNPVLGQSRDRIIENMRFMADWTLSHGLSPANAKWPNIPYPYNTLVYSGIYDGDMVIGVGYTQPDKAGSFAHELVKLWKLVDGPRYLQAAIAIADTLAAHTQKGDVDRSPLPFKVHAVTGEPGVLRNDKGEVKSVYTSNWVGTLELFDELAGLADRPNGAKLVDKRRAAAYRKAHALILDWMKAFPLKSNKWGPFFEDVPGWSDTQINAVTFASYMMDHPQAFPNWKTEVRGILDWVVRELGNKEWERYGVVVVNEQTAYRVPGNSHTSRQCAAELRYAELTGDTSHKDNAVRGLSWATYMVDGDGKNKYPRDDVWMTDGYGDYVRHYLRAMAAAPELAPGDSDHILRSSTIVNRVQYAPDAKPGVAVAYSTWDAPSIELIRMSAKPKRVTGGKDGDVTYSEVADVGAAEGWTWQPLAKGGVLRIRHDGKKNVTVER